MGRRCLSIESLVAMKPQLLRYSGIPRHSGRTSADRNGSNGGQSKYLRVRLMRNPFNTRQPATPYPRAKAPPARAAMRAIARGDSEQEASSVTSARARCSCCSRSSVPCRTPRASRVERRVRRRALAVTTSLRSRATATLARELSVLRQIVRYVVPGRLGRDLDVMIGPP